MSDIDDLQKSVAQLKADAVGSKAALGSIKSDIATIVGKLNPGGLTADEVSSLKTSIADALVASDDAAATATATLADANAAAGVQAPAQAAQ